MKSAQNKFAIVPKSGEKRISILPWAGPVIIWVLSYLSGRKEVENMNKELESCKNRNDAD